MYKILLVEDDRIYQDLGKIILTRANYLVEIAADGASTIDFFKRNKYEVILLDINLPDISGIEIAKMIRSLELFSLSHTPIIAVTGVGADLKAVCLEAGMDDFISKPFKKEQFLQLIAKYCHNPIQALLVE